LPLREARERFEKAYLEYQLQACEGSVSRVAERVGIERTHLYRKLRSLGIDPRQIKDSARD
jgi:DNA-binding NtrC family response regulator